MSEEIVQENKQKKKTNKSQYIAFIVMFLVGAIGGVLIIQFIEHFAKADTKVGTIINLVISLVFLLVAFVYDIAIHEAGHLIFGLLSGYTFSSYRIGSFMWIKENGKLKVKRYSLAGTGGQCLMVPPDMVDGKFPVILFNLGGAIMNLLSLVIFMLAAFLIRDIPMVLGILCIFAFFGATSAIINGIPMRLGTIDNDGYNAYALRKSPEGMRSFWVQLRANEQISKGVRLKDMPAEWFEFPKEEHMNNSMAATMAVFACNRLMDENRFEEAEEKMRYYCEQDNAIVGLHKNLLKCDILFCMILKNAEWKETVAMMTEELKTFMKSMKTFPSVIRTQYAYALFVDKDEKSAKEYKEQFEKISKTYPYQSDIESELELIHLLDKTYEERKNESILKEK